ncbi:hypothetical protein OAH23_03755 [Verrucomicrobia bacterium]|nr:hypothetical protein [Verrucomicrobiota bacterium]
MTDATKTQITVFTPNWIFHASRLACVITFAEMVDFDQGARRAKDEHVWLKALAPVHNNGNVKTLRNVFDGFHTDVGYFGKGPCLHFAANL